MHESYALTLYQFLLSQDIERIETIIQYGHRIDLAGMIASAYHSPKQLKAIELKFQVMAGMHTPRDVALARAREIDATLRGLPGVFEEES